MERIVHLDIELLPEGLYLGTSEDVQGLVVEAATIQEVIEIARDLIPMLLDYHERRTPAPPAPKIVERLRVPVPVAA